jgi:hypothetical protein
MMDNTYFVVVKSICGRDNPSKYYGQIPFTIRDRLVWGIRLDDPAVAEIPIVNLYERYKASLELGALPDSNLTAADYWTRIT